METQCYFINHCYLHEYSVMNMQFWSVAVCNMNMVFMKGDVAF